MKKEWKCQGGQKKDSLLKQTFSFLNSRQFHTDHKCAKHGQGHCHDSLSSLCTPILISFQSRFVTSPIDLI